MYISLKNTIKGLIPKQILFKYEPELRVLLYPFYSGSKFHCNICNKGLRTFIKLNDGDKLCPNCGSLSRTRRLYNIVNAEFINQGIKVLDFSPSRSIYRAFKNNPLIEYTSTDISGDFISDFKFDITQISAKNDSYDLIICYHVLEHIDNDSKAMDELYRVLKTGGVCIIQTPFKEGEIYENSAIVTEGERLKHFGQVDHVRVYSVAGLVERLKKSNFKVDVRRYTDETNNKNGFKSGEVVLICSK